MTTYHLTYDLDPLATVQIDHAKADPSIREMVEFWAWWEDRLASNGGDYTRTWLKQLALYIVRRGRIPHDDEGWCPLDGNAPGIKVTSFCPWEPDEDLIEVVRA